MSDLPLSYSLFFIVILLILTGFFSMSESSLFFLGRHQRERMKKEGKKSAVLIEGLLKDPYSLIITILLLDEIINISYSSVVASTVRRNMEKLNASSREAITTLISVAV